MISGAHIVCTRQYYPVYASFQIIRECSYYSRISNVVISSKYCTIMLLCAIIICVHRVYVRELVVGTILLSGVYIYYNMHHFR